MAWERSNRKSELPPDWATRRLRILRRDQYHCQALVYGRKCNEPANQVDHIRRGTDHSEGNLQALCRDCHAKKSAMEGWEARRWIPRNREPEAHPGMI